MTDQSILSGAYLAKGIIGNVKMDGAPIVDFGLVVVPSTHAVSGTVHVRQAVQGGEYTGNVHGTIYSTGLGNVTQVVGLRGEITSVTESTPNTIPFIASMAIDSSWNGKGAFSYGNVHVEDVPVKPL